MAPYLTLVGGRGGAGPGGRRGPPGPPPIVNGRVPPHDLDAEAAVLSAIMLDRMALDRVLEILKPEHFYSDANGRIYEAALALASEQPPRPVDAVTVASYLRDREKLAQIGGPTYLAQLADATPAVAHVGAHAQGVYEKWRLRAVIATCQRVAAEGYGDVGVVQEFIDGCEQDIYQLARTAQNTSVQPINQVLRAAFKQITDAADRGGRITGISTGYEKLDGKTAGLHNGDLTIIAARPGMGKTSFVLNIGVNVASPVTDRYQDHGGQWQEAQRPGLGVAVFSLEMPREQLAARMACSEGRVDVGKLRQGMLQPDDWRRLTEAAAYLSSLPIWIDDTSTLSVLELRAKVRRIQAEYNRPAVAADPARGIKAKPEQRLGLVVVDYLQLMKGRDGVNSREQEISEISRGLKVLAKELGVPVIALSQLNRAVETRSTKDKRPQLSDLRESGAIEQDADNIIFIYRDEYYNPETTNSKGIAELLISKQRNGSTGKVLTRFTASCTRFDNLAAGDYPEMDE
jgi:replicative DNA helicase